MRKQRPAKTITERRYRKRPVIIRAFQTEEPLDITTLEGVMHADPGDYIVTGVKDELYPVKPAIFETTYDLVDENEPVPCPNCEGRGWVTVTTKHLILGQSLVMQLCMLCEGKGKLSRAQAEAMERDGVQ